MKRICLLLLLCLLLVGCGKSPSDAAAASPVPSASPSAPPPPADDLRISEVMTSNESFPVKGDICDWVELYNADDHPVQLSCYCLSKDRSDLLDCPLPDVLLQPGEYFLLSCEKDLTFRLSKNGVSLFLTAASGAAADEMTVPALGKDQSFTAEYGTVDTPTPGSANDPAAASLCRAEGLYISEVVTSNDHLSPLSKKYYDLIELCNGGSSPVDLSDYCLSDSEKELPGWPLPDQVLESGEYVLIRCTGDAATGAPFSLSAEGEVLYLSRRDGTVEDALSIPALPYERSYGRSHGRSVYFAEPTPGKPNGTGYESRVSAPQVSRGSGQYEVAFTVTLSGEGAIRYTVNGSDPLTHGKLYGGEAIPISGIMSLRAVAVDGDRIPSDVVTWNYMVDLPEYDFDIVMLSLSPVEMITSLNTVDSVAEVSANVALFEDGVEQFSQPCGMSILGSGSRIYEKRSYQISFRGRYGSSALHYKLFDNREQDCFKAFNLRSGSQDQCFAMMRDELLTGLWEEFSDDLLIFAYRPVNVFINGQYWGIYYIRERCNKETVAWHDGVDKDSVDIIRNINIQDTNTASPDWIALTNYIRSNDLSDPDKYAHVTALLDIDSTIDYFAAQMWCTNYDLNNARVFRSSADDGKWRFILYDVDVAFLQSNQFTVSNLVSCYRGMLGNLLKSPEFREKFTLRLGEVLSGPLAEETVLSRIDGFAAMLDHDMHYNCARWRIVNTYEDWLYNVQFMKAQPYVGVTGWNDALIEQYITLVQPEEELIRRAFGDEWADRSSK